MIKPLLPEDLVFLGICDLSGLVRGKSVPAARLVKGAGYTPTCICFTPFGGIAPSPYGTLGDIQLAPDFTTEVDLLFADGTRDHFCLADLKTGEGEPWESCPRDFLRRALNRLERAAGCSLLSSFEQEFVYTGLPLEPRRVYALTTFREQGAFAATLVAALRGAGMEPESFLPEYGRRQCEVTVAPKAGMRSADEAVILRELTRSVAARAGHRATFAPMVEPDGMGNGTHIHMSLRDADGAAAMHAADGPYGLSAIGEHFVAGILEHMPALAAITAPSVCSYYRLTPNRWAPVWANVNARDRAASLRVCPGFGGRPEQFNVEYRVADASACPYMALGALVHAGVDGIERKLRLPAAPAKAFAAMDDAERIAAGILPLPRSLGEAVELLRATPAAADWFGAAFLKLYLDLKLDEERAMAGVDAQEVCDRYAAVY